MKKLLVLFVALALLVTSAYAGTVSGKGYVRATGGAVTINGMTVVGDDSPNPAVAFSLWNDGKGYLTIQGEFCEQDEGQGYGGSWIKRCCDPGHGIANSEMDSRVTLRISWDSNGNAKGWYWVQGSSPQFVVLSNINVNVLSSTVNVAGSSPSFSVNGMNIVTPTFWRPL